MVDKHISYFNLIDALKRKGCGICSIIQDASYRFMDDIYVLLKIDKFFVWINKKNIFGFNKGILFSSSCTIFAERRGVVIVERRRNKLLPESNISFVSYSNIKCYQNNPRGNNLLESKLGLANIGYSYKIVFDRNKQEKEAGRLVRVLEERTGHFKSNAILSN